MSVINKIQHLLYNAAMLFVVGVFCVIVYASISQGGMLPKLEGRLWPVTDRISITGWEPYPPVPNRYRYSGNANKFRDCDYEGIAWWLIEDNHYVRVPRTYFEDAPTRRPVGTLEWEALVTNLNPDQLLYSSYGVVYHNCPYIPWLTETEFYRSPLPIDQGNQDHEQ